MEHGLRTKLLTVATLAVVFVSGGITGYAAAARDGDAAEAPAPPPARRSYVYEQFSPDVAQQAQIDSILRAHRAAMTQLNDELEVIRKQYEASSDSISRATGDAIALVFPLEVRADYLQRLADRREARTRARQEGDAGSRGDRR